MNVYLDFNAHRVVIPANKIECSTHRLMLLYLVKFNVYLKKNTSGLELNNYLGSIGRKQKQEEEIKTI